VNALETLLGGLREVCAGLPDRRRAPGIGGYPMADIGLSAFALFFMGSPSFLAHQRALEEGHGRSNCQTLFGISAIPTDSYIRLMLDGAPTVAFDPLFYQAIETEGVLAPFQRLGGRVLIALDGTEHFCSRKIVSAARHENARTVARNTSTPSWAPPSSHPATNRSCRCRRNSSPPATEQRSRTANATPRSAGWSAMVRRWRIAGRSFSATICSPASQSPPPSSRRAATSF
jgi:hypothetical protein